VSVRERKLPASHANLAVLLFLFLRLRPLISCQKELQRQELGVIWRLKSRALPLSFSLSLESYPLPLREREREKWWEVGEVHGSWVCFLSGCVAEVGGLFKMVIFQNYVPKLQPYYPFTARSASKQQARVNDYIVPTQDKNKMKISSEHKTKQ